MYIYIYLYIYICTYIYIYFCIYQLPNLGLRCGAPCLICIYVHIYIHKYKYTYLYIRQHPNLPGVGWCLRMWCVLRITHQTHKNTRTSLRVNFSKFCNMVILYDKYVNMLTFGNATGNRGRSRFFKCLRVHFSKVYIIIILYGKFVEELPFENAHLPATGFRGSGRFCTRCVWLDSPVGPA